MILVIRESRRAFSASIASNLSCSFIFFLGFARIEAIFFGGAFCFVSKMNEVVFFKFSKCVFRSCSTECKYVKFRPAIYGLSMYLRSVISDACRLTFALLCTHIFPVQLCKRNQVLLFCSSECRACPEWSAGGLQRRCLHSIQQAFECNATHVNEQSAGKREATGSIPPRAR